MERNTDLKWVNLLNLFTRWRHCGKIQSINLFQPSVAFHIETSHLICFVNQMTSFYMERNSGLKLKWVNLFLFADFKHPYVC